MSSVADLDQKLEVMVIPVSDVDRATKFYLRLGWRQDVTPPVGPMDAQMANTSD
jgi:hypothetical protein